MISRTRNASLVEAAWSAIVANSKTDTVDLYLPVYPRRPGTQLDMAIDMPCFELSRW